MSSIHVDFLTQNQWLWLLISWAVIVITMKVLKFEKYGFEIKFYKITYKDIRANSFFLQISNRLKKATKIYSNIGIIVSFVTMGFVFWILYGQISDYFTYSNSFWYYPPQPTFLGSPIVTDFLISISIILIIHKGVKGIAYTAEKIKIKTGGIAIFFGMFSGFVEPNNEELKQAKIFSRLRVIGAGAFSIILFWFVLYAILLTNPYFGEQVDEPILSMFYKLPEGVFVLSIIENSGAEQAGLLANDIITTVNDKQIHGPADFPELNSGEISEVSVLRDGEKLDFLVEVTPSPEDPERGLIGIMRDNSLRYQPVFDFIDWNDRNVSKFLIWMSKISFIVVVINMLPLPFSDGGKLIRTLIDKRFSERSAKIGRRILYGFTYMFAGFSLLISTVDNSWFTI